MREEIMSETGDLSAIYRGRVNANSYKSTGQYRWKWKDENEEAFYITVIEAVNIVSISRMKSKMGSLNKKGFCVFFIV